MTIPSMQAATDLLCRLISAPSVSRSEEATADILYGWLGDRGCSPQRHGNNVWALSRDFDPCRPTLLLNSHHDTVRPNPAYTRNPFLPAREDGRIYGLGSNDAGASVVSLAATFCALSDSRLKFNLLLALTAEEEVSGPGGVRSLLPLLKEQGIAPQMAIIGEPTSMQPAVGERGLVVLDCKASGVAGHAARMEGENALYKALDDIAALRSLTFPRTSPLLGPIGINVTQISAGTQHNIIPAECSFVVDVRTTDAYSNEETVALIRSAISSEATPRSTRLRASSISPAHPLVRACTSLGLTPFVSPSMSDMALWGDIPKIKIGPGESSRSHTADEFVLTAEIEAALAIYPQIIQQLNETMEQRL